jgi:small-conductance mechanosensitive channel
MNKKIEALQGAATQKAQDTADRVEKALEKMIKEGLTINFRTVAETANVSTAYLYQKLELKERIETLRYQQKNQAKPKQAPIASDNSKTVIINNLREEIKRLRVEKDELNKINQSLTGRLYKLQSAENLVERLSKENEALVGQIKDLTERLTDCETRLPQKITPITQAKRNEISETIKNKLEAAGIQLNTTLSKAIKAVPEETVLDAIEAYKEALATNNIERPGAWFKTAIEQGWKPNEAVQVQSELEVFNEWFPLARKNGLAMASQQEKGSIIIYTNDGQWIPFSQMLKEYPLDTL